MWANKNKYHGSKLLVSQAPRISLLLRIHTEVRAGTYPHTRLQTLKTQILEHKVSSTVQPLLRLIPFIEAVWWRGPKFDHAFPLD